MTTSAQRLAGEVRRLRAGSGLSVAETARRAHCSKTTVLSVEHGTASATVDTLDAVLGVFGHRLTIEPIPPQKS